MQFSSYMVLKNVKKSWEAGERGSGEAGKRGSGEAGKRGGMEAWNLEFRICLEFGIWILDFGFWNFGWNFKEIFPTFVNLLTTTPALWITRYCN